MPDTRYESPSDAVRSKGFNWKWLCLRGLAAAVICFVVGVVAPMFRFRPAEHPALAWGLLAVALLANIGFLCAAIAVLIGGIGWAMNAVLRRQSIAEVYFKGRYALHNMKNPAPAVLQGIILHPSGPGHEFGEALIEYKQLGKKATLIALSDKKLGYYLKYINEARDEWLSLGDSGRLSEVVCPDDWEASAGLFVPPENAWKAIREFCETGRDLRP